MRGSVFFFSFLLYSACLFLSDKCLLLRVLCCVFGSDTFHIYIYMYWLFRLLRILLYVVCGVGLSCIGEMSPLHF